MGFADRITNAWNAFRTPDKNFNLNLGMGSSYDRARMPMSHVSGKSLAGTIFNRIAVDAAMVDINHVIIDEVDGKESIVNDGIQNCLTVEANIDQSSKDFIQDLVYSMFDEGVVAVVPVDTKNTPSETASIDILSLRVARITQWFPQHVEVDIYNDRTGERERVVLPKTMVAIIENPLYAITNGPNSTMKRLISKMALLDLQDQLNAQNKLNLIVQLPYTIKSERQRVNAKRRIKEMDEQLSESKYGVAYFDSTEKVTQINREIKSSLMDQVAELTKQVYNQLGLTENVFNGTASEAEMRTYYSRTIDPILTRIQAEFKRKFLSKTARTQGHSFSFRRDLFKLVPAEQLASMADTFTRNAILTPNEVRGILGYAPSKDPESDKLINRNIADKNRGYTKTGTVSSSSDPVSLSKEGDV